MIIRKLVSTALGLILCLSIIESASAGTFTLDGIYNPANDAYTHQFVFPLILDDGTPAGTTELKVGIGENADPNVGGPDDLFVYFEMPLNLKDTTWGTGTHNGYDPNDDDLVNGIIAMNQNTGSEKIEFLWNGAQVEVKLSQRGNGDASDLKDCSNAGTCLGHELKHDGGGAVLGAATSLDYIMNNFPNDPNQFNNWGDLDKNGGAIISNSPALMQDPNGLDIYQTVDPAFADWPFHQSWEIQISGPLTPADLPNLLTSSDFFGADFGGGNPENSNFLLHASPIKAGDKFDVVPDCLPEDCPLEEIPEPSSLALAGCLLFGIACGRRRCS